MNTAFTARVLAVVRGIPVGRVATYGDVAVIAGRPGAARAVGNIMRDCGSPDVPCHRVIAAGGRLGGYGGSEALKRALLIAEGVPVAGSKIRNLAAIRDGRVGLMQRKLRADMQKRKRSKATQSTPRRKG